jgi:hypothetical protein
MKDDVRHTNGEDNVSQTQMISSPGKRRTTGALMGRPPKLITVLKTAQLRVVRDLETRALNGDADARSELFKLAAAP